MANTIDARPRGPNQPRSDRGVSRVCAEHCDRDRQRPYHGQAEQRVQDQLPTQFAERGAEQDGSEDHEGDAVEDVAHLLTEESADRASSVPGRLLHTGRSRQAGSQRAVPTFLESTRMRRRW